MGLSIIKERVYNPMPKNLSDLKENLEREIKNIQKNILESVFFFYFEKKVFFYYWC